MATRQSEAVLGVEIAPEDAYISDLDVYSTLSEAVVASANERICGLLAQFYWERLLPLAAFATYYDLRQTGAGLRKNAPPGLPPWYLCFEVMLTRSVPPAALSLLKH